MDSRRDFLKKGILFALGSVALRNVSFADESNVIDFKDYPKMVKYPGKTSLIMHSDRPPLLETPRSYFASAVTPNEAFFVRWHLANIPTEVNLKEWRLNIT
ncbi:MAG: molybdopterin-dependent oxidoreductase, partial [Sulfurihydrogenibium sp.]